MLPVIELRGGIPLAIGSGITPVMSYIICVVGNMIPIPFILLFIKPVFAWLMKLKPFQGVVKRLENRAMKKSETLESKKSTDHIDEGKPAGKKKALPPAGAVSFWGLMIFVAIPLPGTGAWTGALIAALLNLPFKRSLISVLLGVLTAGVAVTLISIGAFAGAETLKNIFFIK
jgi:uncharacterized membrane protein